MIAALYVATGGCYFGLDGVYPWDKQRDARSYAGPWPVVAHPPCERWGRYWGGAPSTWPRLVKGDDGGCFAAALASVRRWGGVLEHPEGSAAWDHCGLNKPPRGGGWVAADFEGGWTCCVEQGQYGHRARKATWLFTCHADLPALRWGRAAGDFVRLDEGFHSIEERRRAIKTGACQRLSKNQRAATPIVFRDLLISIAQSANPTDDRPIEARGHLSPETKPKPLALSVRQPWAWAIIFAGKDIENRSWQAVNHGLRQRGRIAIHAAKGLTQAEYDYARGFMASIGVTCPPAAELSRGGIIGSVDVIDVVKEHDSPWFFGPRGLVLRYPEVWSFIPCIGALGYFEWRQADASVVPVPARWMLPLPDIRQESLL